MRYDGGTDGAYQVVMDAADPLKALGNVVVKQGNTKEALANYDSAFKFALNWRQLKDAREA